MKSSTLLILLITSFLIFELVKAEEKSTEKSSNDINLLKKNTINQKRMLQQDLFDLEKIAKEIENLNKPSNAFTVVILVYLALIIIGAILVLVLVKPIIEQ